MTPWSRASVLLLCSAPSRLVPGLSHPVLGHRGRRVGRDTEQLSAAQEGDGVLYRASGKPRPFRNLRETGPADTVWRPGASSQNKEVHDERGRAVVVSHEVLHQGVDHV